MTSRFTFVEEPEGLHSAILVEEETVIWEHNSEDHGDFSNSADVTLTDNINDETYMTANEDDNDTQYFSVLDSTDEVILNNDIGSKISTEVNSLLLNNEDDTSVDIAGQQVVLFKVGDTEELYGIQLAQDEDGQIQKYQFRVRHNEDGNLEAVPETIQILPLDSEVPLIEPTDDINNEDQNEAGQNIINEVYIKQELASESHVTSCNEENSNEYADTMESNNINEYQASDIIHYHNDDTLRFTEDNDTHYHENNPGQFDEESENYNYEVTLNESMDCKKGLLEKLTISDKQMFKPEINEDSEQPLQSYTDSDNSPENEEYDTSYLNVSNKPNNSEIGTDLAEQCNEQSHITQEDGSNSEIEETSHYEQLFIKENHVIHGSNNELASEHVQTRVNLEHMFTDENTQEIQQTDLMKGQTSENESENEDYQIVDGVHITGEFEDNSEYNSQITFEESQKILPLQTHVLKLQQQPSYPGPKVYKNIIRNLKIKKVINPVQKKSKEPTYFVIKHLEKENVEEISSLTSVNLKKTVNPRSLLKSSHPSFVESNEAKTEEKFEKRFAKSKEAIQARQFHNFIAQTKIIHAPVRQERLPRKQTIKPVARTDEEIIVQEVVVSSNGYIETSEDGILKERTPIKPTEFIQLLDSDDDYDPKKSVKRKKRSKRQKSLIEITISDTDDDLVTEDDVINLDSEESGNDSESTDFMKSGKSTKNNETETDDTLNVLSKINIIKKRGRPPKNKSGNFTKVDANEENINDCDDTLFSRKRRHSKSNEEEAINSNNQNVDIGNKMEIQCQKCTKTFPSQGSLKTHMQFHTFKEANLKSMRLTLNKKLEGGTNSNSIGYKYKCTKCQESFINNILLTRHLNAHKGQTLVQCNICHQKFDNKIQLDIHKKRHFKEQMCRTTTTITKFSPKKQKITNSFKCLDCTRIFTSQHTLESHMKVHKRFTCLSCGSSFRSRLLLDDHITKKCVKSPKCKRNSLKPRPINKCSPRFIRKTSSVRKSEAHASTLCHSLNQEKVKVPPKPNALKCDKCPRVFDTHTKLYAHKIIPHDLCTPDKSIVNATSKSAFKNSHGGVPAGGRLQNAFASLSNYKEK